MLTTLPALVPSTKQIRKRTAGSQYPVTLRRAPGVDEKKRRPPCFKAYAWLVFAKEF